jgi:hypothetical protein
MSVMKVGLNLPKAGMGRPMSMTVSEVLNNWRRLSSNCLALRRNPELFGDDSALGMLLFVAVPHVRTPSSLSE